jgi:hypothetical protein
MQHERLFREMTVANIREPELANHLEVVFLESARFYKLRKDNPTYQKILSLLHDAMAKGGVLKVRFASPDSDVIEEVQSHGSAASEG